MDERELHLVLNHFPVILSVMALFASLVAIATRSRAAWLYAAASLTIAGLFSYPTYMTGHGAHEVLEDLWYVKADSWHEHQEAAGLANIMLLAGGAFAAFAWWKLTRSREAVLARWMELVLIFACALGASTMGRAAWLGGKVIREQEALKTPPKGWIAPPRMEHEHEGRNGTAGATLNCRGEEQRPGGGGASKRGERGETCLSPLISPLPSYLPLPAGLCSSPLQSSSLASPLRSEPPAAAA